jgi:hypothetical protein
MDEVQPLPYADLLSRWGVGYESTPSRFRLVIPPIPSWRQLPRAFLLALAPLPFFVVFVGQLASNRFSLSDEIVPLLQVIFLQAIMGFAAWTRLKTRLIFDVTANYVSVVRRPNLLGIHRRWPRSSILEIRPGMNPFAMVMRIRHEDSRIYYVSPNAQVTAAVIDRLNDAVLKNPPLEPASEIAVPIAAARLRSKIIFQCSFGIGLLILAAGLALCALQPRAGTLLAGAGLTTMMVSAGIYLGTQQKEFFP